MGYKKERRTNLDFLGNRWELAPGGKKLFTQCQLKLSQLQIEMTGLGALFKNMEDCELSSEELQGLGLTLERMSKRLSKNLTELSKAVIQEND